jgi:hypothetical protein
MWSVKFIVLFLTFSLGQSSSLLSHDSPSPGCSYHFTDDLPMQSSAWKVLLESGTFSPVQDNTDHHMKRLRHKLAELAAIVDFHKENYAQDVFGDSFQQIEKEVGDLQYPAVIPAGSEI